MNCFEKDQVSGAVDEPRPLECLHINQGSMDAAADAYEAEYVAEKARRAYDNTYHKIRAEVGFDLWLKIWKKALAALSRAQQAPAVSDEASELRRQLADIQLKHEVACSTLEVVKDQRTVAQRALAAQCEETERLRALLSQPVAAPVSEQTEQEQSK
jgi:hypothetical protein